MCAACGSRAGDDGADGGDKGSADATVTASGDGEGDGDGSGESSCPEMGCLDLLPGGGCDSAAECVLYDDCCRCEGRHVDEDPPPACEEECDQTKCAALGITQAACGGGDGPGLCGPATECRTAEVTCQDDPPDCGPDMLPTAIDGCWGACIPATTCREVDDCTACPESAVCVLYAGLMEDQYTCIARPPNCPDPVTCDCFAENPCEGGEIGCSEIEGGLVCQVLPIPN